MFLGWLKGVFTVLWDFSLAPGILTESLAATAFHACLRVAFLGAAAGGTASAGVMAAVNVAIDSDFKRPPLGIAAIWRQGWSPISLKAGAHRSSRNRNKESDHETP